MPALAPALRRNLENTVVKARELAERGARASLEELDVAGNSHFASMTAEQERQRRRLRAHGRQLGDQAGSSKGCQSIERLVRETAYEHWHRMLFARFLAENKLLIEPSSGVAISLDECEELASEEGTDLWGLAAQFAQAMLPQIFRLDDPVLAVKLPLEIRQQLQGLVAGLETEIFIASDSLGWTYQFWQTAAKKAVNESGVKIGADELPAVTQLFTEDYMVDFLLDNTLGAWHAGKVLAANPQLASTAQTEDELRQAVALPGCPWSYLRFIKADNGQWAPASGTFEGWPKTAAELKCLDPCMGSGHFVVAMFERLVALRQAEGEQMEAAAVAAVIESNLFGLEIDPRCTQIAAFNLALAAWRRIGHCKLPAMNLACSGLAPNTREADWLAMACDNERLRNGMERLYRLFQKASVLGSLINPRGAEGDLLVADFHELQPLLEQALAQEIQDDTRHEMAVTARGLAKAAEILAADFTLIATNVPYLARGKQHDILKSHIEMHCNEGKADLATAFIMHSLTMCSFGGSVALVTPQNWLFLKAYAKLREKLLVDKTWNILARLGSNAFQDMNWWAATTALVVLSAERTTEWLMPGIDVSSDKSQQVKADRLANQIATKINIVPQSIQLKNPDSVISFEKLNSLRLLGAFAGCYQGTSTGDNPRFVKQFWEGAVGGQFQFFQGPANSTKLYGGRDSVIQWDQVEESSSSAIRGESAWGRQGVAIGQMRRLPATLYRGEKFSNSTPVIIPFEPSHLPAIYAFCSSNEFESSLRMINQKLSVDNGYVGKIEFDLARWQEEAADRYPSGLPKPFSNDPTQWLFHGHPKSSSHPLQVAVARLVGYRWPAEIDSTIELSDEAHEWIARCEGLVSHGNDDGIVCLSPVRGESAAADRLRSLLAAAFGDEWSNAKERELLLETAVANDAQKPASDLGEWLRQNFFAEHCKLFQSRPFIWQVWDGNPNGFSALVNYHKLAAPSGQGRKTLELLTYTYLARDWIERQKQDQSDGVDGADDRLAAAIVLQGQLEKILEGEPPYDVFVRWKPLNRQSIGWDPDINDGVRLNIRPFLKAQLRNGGKKGGGILRWKPFDFKRKADRGSEPVRTRDDFPWFWGWDESDRDLGKDFGAPISGAPPAGDSFDGNRWNDLHYSRAAKEAARAQHTGGES